MITRLGDQTSSFNIGRSRIPTNYPKNTPTFQLAFFKTAAMSSFWSSARKKYTNVNATVHFTYA